MRRRTMNTTTSVTTAGIARTAQTSVSDIGTREVRNPTGTVNTLKSPREITCSVNSGKRGSRKYIAAARTSGMNIHSSFSSRRAVGEESGFLFFMRTSFDGSIYINYTGSRALRQEFLKKFIFFSKTP